MSVAPEREKNAWSGRPCYEEKAARAELRPPLRRRCEFSGRILATVVDPCGADGRFAGNHCQSDYLIGTDAIMNENTTLFNRIGRWLRREVNGELPLRPHAPQQLVVKRGSFLRPWARRDAAIEGLRDGFVTLTDLMAAIRDSVEKQN